MTIRAVPAESRRSYRSIAIVRALQLGDLICATPALRSLRAGFPEARLTLVGLPWARGFVERYRDTLDDFLEFPGWYGIPEREPDPARIAAFEAEARTRRFDLVVQLHGDGGSMNAFLPTLRAAAAAGFVPAHASTEMPTFLPYPETLPEPLRLLRLAEHIGGMPTRHDLDFPLTDGDRREAEELRIALGLGPRGYVVMHVGSGAVDRRWPVGRFAAVADTLHAAGWPVVLTGVEAERPLTAEVARRAGAPLLDVTGRTSLGGLGALIEGAQLLVANDTGVSHIAAALRTPSVVVFTGSERQRWAPLDGTRHTAVGLGSACGRPNDGPSVAEVVEAARRRLRVAA